MTLENAKLRAEMELFSRKNVNTTFKSNIDYTTQNQFLRTRIAELKNKI